MKTLPKLTIRTLVTNPSPEAELILCCARTHIDTATAERIQTLLQQGINWTYLIRAAVKHGVIQLLYRNLNATCPESVPKASLDQLRGFFHTNARHNLFLTNELLKLLDLLKDQGVRAIPYKGPVLAASVYGKLSLRQFGDLDILVHEQDFKNSRELLISQGYQLKEKFDREQSFVHRDSNVEVDLHWGLTPFYFPLAIDFDRLWQCVKPVSLAETTIISFSSEDLLLILCVQVAKDCWERRQQLEQLAKVCDIAELIQARPTLDWGQVGEQANTLGAARMFCFALFLAKNLLGVALPEDVWLEIQADSVAISLAEQACAYLFREGDDLPTLSKNSLFDLRFRVKQLTFYLRMRERFQHKIKHILEILRTVVTIVPNFFWSSEVKVNTSQLKQRTSQ